MTRKVFNNNIYCMGKKIGIKLADGSFYPIMEDGVPQKKLMELTTVQDNQTTASIDLYRSESGTMDDAEYVDTLELSELKPHPGGETNMSFIIQLDENNMLSAEVCDPESGKTSVTKADLVNFPAETRTASSDSMLSGISDVPVSAPKKTSLGIDSFDLSDFDLDEFASLGDSHVDALLGKDDTLVPDDFKEPVVQDEAESFDLPDFEEPVVQDETASFDLPDFEEPVVQEEAESFDLPDFEEPVVQDEAESFDLPDFEEPVVQEETASFDLPDFEEPVVQEEAESFDLPDFEEPVAQDETESFELPDFEEPVAQDETASFDLPDFEEPVVQEETASFELPDFEEPVAQDETESFELPDFEEPVAQEETASFDLPDFEEPVVQEETASFDLPDFGEPVVQEETASFDLPDFEEPVVQEETASFDLPDFEEPVVQDEAESFDLPDFEEPVVQDETASFDMPPFDFGNGPTGFAARHDSPQFDEPDSVYEDSLPDFSKFELPDFDDPLRNDFSFTEESGLFTENDFKDPAFNMNEPNSSSNPFDFSDLYDHKEDDLKPQTERKGRGNVAVIICVICTLICVGILLFILFLLPSKLGTGFLLLGNDGATTENGAVEEPDETAAVEDVIVIVETPSVTPVQPPQATKKSDVVRYQVKWGDTLWDIAQSYYNNPWLYHRIASANKIKNPDYIMAGTILVIPPQ